MNRQRILIPAEMTGRELARRPVALALLILLPLAFYAAQSSHSDHAAVTGGVAMAFSVAGGSIFAALTARPVDQRLALAGYRPYELLLGRLLVLESLGLAIAAGFSAVMVLGSGPSEPWAVVGGVVLVAMASVPFGLAVGALASHELDGVLVLIGVVGIQLTLDTDETVGKFLPFWGAKRLIEHGIDPTVSLGIAIPLNLAYAVVLLAIAAYMIRRRAPALCGAETAGRPSPMAVGG